MQSIKTFRVSLSNYAGEFVREVQALDREQAIMLAMSLLSEDEPGPFKVVQVLETMTPEEFDRRKSAGEL